MSEIKKAALKGGLFFCLTGPKALSLVMLVTEFAVKIVKKYHVIYTEKPREPCSRYEKGTPRIVFVILKME